MGITAIDFQGQTDSHLLSPIPLPFLIVIHNSILQFFVTNKTLTRYNSVSSFTFIVVLLSYGI